VQVLNSACSAREESRLAGHEGLPVTTELLWRATVLLSVIAVAVLPLVAWLVPRRRFEALRLDLAGATFVVWFLIWSTMVLVYWGDVYSFFFPWWLRWPLPFLMASGYAGVSLLMFRVARCFPRWPAVAFVLLGASLGPLTHLVAVFRGIVEKPPLLRGASPVAAVIVSAPEFALYFSIIIGVAGLTARFRQRS
jgi:hypothetical protein